MGVAGVAAALDDVSLAPESRRGRVVAGGGGAAVLAGAAGAR